MRNIALVLAMVGCGVLVVGAGRPVASPSSPLPASDRPVAVNDGTGDEVGEVIPIVPRGPAITAVVAGEADGLILVDVFVSGVVDLRGYQVTLADVIGSQGGRLHIEDIWIDTDRADYVFASEQAVTAVDLVGGRLVGAMFSGSVNALRPAYAGTFAYWATPEAQGNFKVHVQMGRKTLLRNAASEAIAFRAGPAAVVAVGEIPAAPRPR